MEFRGYYPHSGPHFGIMVGVKERRTQPRVEYGVYFPILHPYEPNLPFHHQRNHLNWYLDVYVLLMDGILRLR